MLVGSTIRTTTRTGVTNPSVSAARAAAMAFETF
jgi:hypothetical protein